MPLRDDLLQPIPGENPSGTNLQYDVKVFDVIKEARLEDDDSLPSGEWERAPKKADRVLVIKIAGESLATRSKDLRLAAWYLESLIRKEGFPQLNPGLEYFQKLQEEFWETLYPEKDPDDGSLDLRVAAVELAASLIGAQLKLIPLTRSGINFIQYQDARSLGFENDSRSDEKAAIRADAVARGRLVAEDTEKGIQGTPKAFYAETEAQLVKALEQLNELDGFHEEKYGSDYPSVGRLKSSLEDVKKVITFALNEKRKTEPDPKPAPELGTEGEAVEGAEGDASEADADGSGTVVVRRVARVKREVPAGLPTDEEGAYLQVGACAEVLRGQNLASCVPYLLCTALRFGETRSADLTDLSFPVAPSTETRLTLRTLAKESRWDELMARCIQTLPEPCGRTWLDLHRYMWRAAQELGHNPLASTIASTVRSLLNDFPQVRTLTLDDDTSAANPETQQWLDSEVLR